MRNLDLNNYCVQEMNAGEMSEVDGGYYNYASPTFTTAQIKQAGQAMINAFETVGGFFCGFLGI